MAKARRRARRLLAGALLLPLAACASYRNYRGAQLAEQRGDWDQAVLEYMRALADDPGNVTYRSALMRAKIAASQAHFEKGKAFFAAGLADRALIELQQAVQLDPSNQYAEVELRKAREALQAARESRAPITSLQELKDRNRGAMAQPPVLSPRSTEPISLDFPEPVSSFDIYRALGKAFGINILFDPNLKEQQIAIELKEVTAQTALETLMRTLAHFYKVIDEHSIIIAADTPQNRRIYEDLVIQTFFLSNADVKEVVSMLRSLVDAKKIATNTPLNAIVLRDTADRVKVAERIIQANDKSAAEVVVDVELLQINSTKLAELGLSLSQYRVTQSLDLGAGGGANAPAPVLHVSDLEFLDQSNWALTIPSFIYDFVKTSGDAQLLARPQVRILEGESGKVHIGDRVPVPVTTFNTGQTIGGNIVPVTSFQYQDIGIRIDIEPRVHHNKEVTLKLKVEVSNLAGSIDGPGGQSQPIIGTRTVESTIRLQDGETNFLAGLIRTDDSSSKSGMPGLSEIPVIGRLFSKRTRSAQRTDLILTLTPHIVRTPDVTAEDLAPIWVGTEMNISFRGGSPRAESDVEGPFEGEETDPEQVRELIRQRLQRLPRGLQEGAEEPPTPPEEAPPAETPPGVELTPATPPTDIFREPEPPPPPEEPEEPPPPAAAKLGGDDGEALELWSSAMARASLAAQSAPGLRPAVRLRLVPSLEHVAAGQLFELRLVADAQVAISHLPLALGFDPEALQVEKVEPGDFLGPAGTAQVLADFSRPGEVLIGASRLGEVPGVAGQGVVAKVLLRARKPGRPKIEFMVKSALDATLRTVSPLVAEPLVLDVREAAPPGEPDAPAERQERREPPAPRSDDGAR